MNGKLSWLGKAEGFTTIALLILCVLTGLTVWRRLTGPEFLQGLQWLGMTFFGGGALSSFRDLLTKKG